MSELKMKKVLILAYDFPPYVSVGGLRPYNWYRYLKEFGIEPIVVTRQWSNTHGNHLDYVSPSNSAQTIIEKTEYGTIIRSAYQPTLSNKILLKYGPNKYKSLRKINSIFNELIQFPFSVGPKYKIYLTAEDYLKQNKVDCIIATGDPFILFKYASKLGKKFQTPWVADYRDAWVQDKTRSRNIFLKAWNSFFENRYLKNVSKIITVSTFLQKQVERNLSNKDFSLILNGFNPEAIDKTFSIAQNNDCFTISFAGTIYKWHPIESFLRTLEKFGETTKIKAIRVNFYGINNQEELQKIISNSNYLKSVVHFFPRTENETLVKELAKANLFLLFNDYSILGTKIFTYLGIKRKIILCYSDDIESKNLKSTYFHLTDIKDESNQLQAEIIQSTNSGIIVKDANHLLEVLGELYQEFENTGSIACNSNGIEKYSRKIQVEKLAELLASIQPLVSIQPLKRSLD
jgi:glycosyltransferase involved in cell wall biosynthesis